MASSDNLISLEPMWGFRPKFAAPWLNEAFARDTETLTRALQKSLSSNQSDVLSGGEMVNPFYQPEGTPAHTPTASGGSEAETMPSKRQSGAVGVNGGKITKRKSRASKQATTTFIIADPANFRQMVQQVTGVRLGGIGLLPAAAAASAAVLKPEPQLLGTRIQCGCLLPTLDTSAFLLEPTNQHQHQQVHHQVGPSCAPGMAVVSQAAAVSVDPQPPVVSGAGDGGVGGSVVGFDFESFCSFPTLESWN